jgi:hypothetical protein
MRIKMGVKCDGVGVLGQPYVATLCLKFQNANPRIYPWEATHRLNPRIYSWEKDRGKACRKRPESQQSAAKLKLSF